MSWFGGNKGPREGSNIGGLYTLDVCIAETRFSDVYRGTQRSTGQPVAVKVLRLGEFPKEDREPMRERFFREMSACAKLRHPNVVRLLDRGQLGNKILYLVFDFVEGVTLGSVLQQEGNIAPFEARRLMSQCLDGLAAGHAQGIVHRDFKPGNVMVTSTGAQRNAVVLDFGLAGATSMWESMLGVRTTEPGQVPGTAAYLAPEQIEGEITAQSDIYAWGLVYIECLTGERVVDGRTDFDMVMQHVNGNLAVPPSLRRHALGAILERAIATDTDNRYPSAQAVLEDLRRCPMASLDVPASEDHPVVRALPSYVLEDLERATKEILPPTLPLVALEAPNAHCIGDDLDILFEAYAQMCANHGVAMSYEQERFVSILARATDELCQNLACHKVDFAIEFEDGTVKVRPLPSWPKRTGG